MADDGEWPRAVAEALPPSARVTGRLASPGRMQKRADADHLADLAIRQTEAPTPSAMTGEDRAAGAEALAYRAAGPTASNTGGDRQAEDDATADVVLNLAEVYQRVGDDPAGPGDRRGQSPSSVDEITPGLRYSRPSRARPGAFIAMSPVPKAITSIEDDHDRPNRG